MRGLALTEWSVVPHYTLLRVSTAHHTARVNTTLLATDVDTAHSDTGTVSLVGAGLFSGAASSQVKRVARVAILTDTGAVMIVSDTPGVGTTLDIATCVNTPVLTLDRLADLIVATVQVGGAGGGLSSLPHIIGITLESSETQALAILAHGVGATSLGSAEVSHQRLVSITSFKWVSFVARFTATVKASLGVDADSIASTDLVATLVDVKAANEGVAIKSLFTLAHLARVSLSDTLCIISALTRNTDIHSSAGSTAIIWVATIARVTLTLIGDVVDTVTVGSTPWCTDGWRDWWHTQEVAISYKTLLTETFVGVGITGSIETTG